MEKKIIIMDTDIGSDIDDALCLLYLLKQPLCKLLGITTCSSEPEKRAEIADSICHSLGKNIPIYPGRDSPLIGKQLQIAVHQYDIVKTLPHKYDYCMNCSIDFLRTMIEANPHKITLLSVGPLTNIGALISAYPHIIPYIKDIFIMGGSYFKEATSAFPIEWNIKNDPVAAKIVFDSGISIYSFGLDVTLKLKVLCTDFLKDDRSSVMKPVDLYARKFLERTNDMYFHDPLAAVCIFEDQVCTYKRGYVEIGIDSNWGRSIFVENKHGNVLLADNVNSQHFFDCFYTTIERCVL